jgi:hypothetical protein
MPHATHHAVQQTIYRVLFVCEKESKRSKRRKFSSNRKEKGKHRHTKPQKTTSFHFAISPQLLFLILTD